MISCEHRSQPASLAYLFRVLDLQSTGSLGAFEVNYFVRDIVQGLLDTGDEPPELPTIVDEVFDLAKMRKPKCRSYNMGAGVLPGGGGLLSRDASQPPRITLAELRGSGAGAIIMQMLTDVQVRERESLSCAAAAHTHALPSSLSRLTNSLTHPPLLPLSPLPLCRASGIGTIASS